MMYSNVKRWFPKDKKCISEEKKTTLWVSWSNSNYILIRFTYSSVWRSVRADACQCLRRCDILYNSEKLQSTNKQKIYAGAMALRGA